MEYITDSILDEGERHVVAVAANLDVERAKFIEDANDGSFKLLVVLVLRKASHESE